MCEAKFLVNTEIDKAYRILRTEAIAVTLKYLNNFWQSLEMLSINSKVEVKRRWTKYYVLASIDNNNHGANSNHTIFVINDAKLYVPVFTLSA